MTAVKTVDIGQHDGAKESVLKVTRLRLGFRCTPGAGMQSVLRDVNNWTWSAYARGALSVLGPGNLTLTNNR